MSALTLEQHKYICQVLQKISILTESIDNLCDSVNKIAVAIQEKQNKTEE